MVDKVWSDWQNKNPDNLWAYKGGSVQNLTSVQALKDWPNGMAPELTVSLVWACFAFALRLTAVVSSCSWTRPFLRTECSLKSPSATS